MKHSEKFVLTAGVAAALLAMSPAQAVTQTYCGPNLCYQYDDAQAAAALYGLPSFSGDDAYFTPTVFEARSVDGVGIHTATNTDFVDGTWVFSKIWTLNPANEIGTIFAYEEGDYEVNYAGGEVHGDLYLSALGLNAIEATIIDTDSVDFYGPAAGLWDMIAVLTPQATFTQLANNMSLTIQNQLSAYTANTTVGSELAYIEKKLILQINTLLPSEPPVVIPVPAAAWLFGSGLGILGWLRRRSARAA